MRSLIALVPLLLCSSIAEARDPAVICQDNFSGTLECRRMDGLGPTVTEVPPGWVLEITDILPVVNNQGNLFINGGTAPIIVRVAPGPIQLQTPIQVHEGQSMTWNGDNILLMGRVRRVP